MTPGLLCPDCVQCCQGGTLAGHGAGPFPAHVCPWLLFLWSPSCSACKAWGFLLSPRYQRPLSPAAFTLCTTSSLLPLPLLFAGPPLLWSGLSSSSHDHHSQAHMSDAARDGAGPWLVYKLLASPLPPAVSSSLPLLWFPLPDSLHFRVP